MKGKFLNYFSSIINERDLQLYITWLQNAPKTSIYRINTLNFDVESIITKVEEHLKEQQQKYSRKNVPKVYKLFTDVVAIDSWPLDDNHEGVYDTSLQDVIVDASCGSAVLRGANVFAPAVMGLTPDTVLNGKVNIMADASGKCKQGLKIKYENEDQVFVGSGALKMTRKQLFNLENIKPKGIAIETIMPESRVPVIDHNIFPEGSCLLQNLPSVICSKVLDPKPGEVVIDMCAAPGNKTTHLAELMQDKGIIIALDKTSDKINLIRRQCDKWKLKSIHPFPFDSTKALIETEDTKNEEYRYRDILCGPPFLPESFDKVLLDAPCSALGQRPLLKLSMNEKCLKSFAILQKKLFYSAVGLLKKNGTLVYSTCTIRTEECENIVAWALSTFPCLKLVPATPLLGDPGWPDCNLTDEQRFMVQRFGPKTQDSSRNTDEIYNINDTIGFFIACFIKV